jgi:hypothetical protein
MTLRIKDEGEARKIAKRRIRGTGRTAGQNGNSGAVEWYTTRISTRLTEVI